ncbi:gp25 [Synechococcus phage S-CAM8]|uniref:Gp25 n=1 Tax=Synechococcus phage S-CAM8 TaxID=754038 RepID=G8EXV7_9CAUD|nr:gp25 [Synechococcus phage S-CAM8]
MTQDLSKYDFGGLERHPANILRLISELEGSYQLLKYMGFEEDMNILNEMKKPYYKLYFKTLKEEKLNGN